MHGLKSWHLFAICVLTWGTTWYAITFQIGHTAPEVGVALRFALAGSVLTFACYLTLQERIGPGPTGTIGVMTPLLALVVSMIFEAFRPDVLTMAGAALAVAGNVLMLRRAASMAARRRSGGAIR